MKVIGTGWGGLQRYVVASMALALGAVVFLCAEGTARADESFGTCTPSASALVQEGKDLEGMKRDDRAVRHYSDALTLDRSCGDAYIALGTLRLKGGDAREAERIYTVALTTLPSLPEAYAGRARARRILGNRDGARQDLAKYATLRGGFESLKELASSYGEDGLAPAQLATWRLILDLARIARDEAQSKEASRMVRALQIVVGQADPVAFPPRVLGARAALAHIARRGG